MLEQLTEETKQNNNDHHNLTVVYRCSKVMNRLRENKSVLQTKTEGTKLILRLKQRNNRSTEVQQQQQQKNDNTTHTETNCKITSAFS